MERAKLSGELLVWKGPPLALVRTEAAAEAEQDVPSGAAADEAGSRRAVWFIAIAVAAIAVGGTIGLALLPPVVSGSTPPPLAIPLPQAAATLALRAVAPGLRPPALQPASIAAPTDTAPPARPATASKLATLAGGRAANAAISASPGKPARAASAVNSRWRARGDALFASGHLAAARDDYRRAAAFGDGRAALQLGETYDPAFLAQAGIGRHRGDPAIAAYWYQRAGRLGMPDADVMLRGVAAEVGAALPR
jgi:hypothetical protein